MENKQWKPLLNACFSPVKHPAVKLIKHEPMIMQLVIFKSFCIWCVSWVWKHMVDGFKRGARQIHRGELLAMVSKNMFAKAANLNTRLGDTIRKTFNSLWPVWLSRLLTETGCWTRPTTHWVQEGSSYGAIAPFSKPWFLNSHLNLALKS